MSFKHEHHHDHDPDNVHVNVASPVGGYTVGSVSFFRYIVRLAEFALPLSVADREAIAILDAIPHAFEADEDVHMVSGRGWRIVPAQGDLDWPVLEVTPQRLRAALERAHALLWRHAAAFPVNAHEMTSIERELDLVFAVLLRAEAAGFVVNVSYVA